MSKTSQQSVQPIKAFNIDFNWDNRGPARPGFYAQAKPAEHVQWYRDLGADTIQTFCVSYNGYAWYRDSAVAPVTPDMTSDFLPELTDLAHRQDMRVLGYFCFGANPVWKAQHPDSVYAYAPMEEFTGECVGSHGIVYTDEYLDYFTRMVQDVLRKTDIDGFMIDWIRPTSRQGKAWLPREKQLYRELMHRQFPLDATADSSEILEYNRRILDRAWVRIKEAVDSVRPAIVWTNHPFEKANDPLWNGHRILKEADWILNESANSEFLPWLSKQVGSHTRIIQNLSGWRNHDANMWKDIEFPKYGLYGFAQADPVTTFPSRDYTPSCAANLKNIEIVREAYRTLGARGNTTGRAKSRKRA